MNDGRGPILPDVDTGFFSCSRCYSINVSMKESKKGIFSWIPRIYLPMNPSLLQWFWGQSMGRVNRDGIDVVVDDPSLLVLILGAISNSSPIGGKAKTAHRHPTNASSSMFNYTVHALPASHLRRNCFFPGTVSWGCQLTLLA